MDEFVQARARYVTLPYPHISTCTRLAVICHIEPFLRGKTPRCL